MQTYPVDAAVRGESMRSTFFVIAEVALSLRGDGDLSEATGSLIKLISAERALVVRIQDGRERRLGITDQSAGQLFSNRRPPSVAAEMLSVTEMPMLPGKVLLLSRLVADGLGNKLESTNDICMAAGVRDVAVLVLDLRGDGYDAIEFHFGTRLSGNSEAMLDAMAPALSRLWAHRLPGTAQTMMERTRCRTVARTRNGADIDILTPENPAGLSKSEFRICAMIQEGMMSKAISEELGIQRSTIRTHLHSIYAKTGTSGHIELVHRLTGSQLRRAAAYARGARRA